MGTSTPAQAGSPASATTANERCRALESAESLTNVLGAPTTAGGTLSSAVVPPCSLLGEHGAENAPGAGLPISQLVKGELLRLSGFALGMGTAFE